LAVIDFLERAREFVADVVAPNAARWEAERAYPRDAFKAAGEAGLCGLLVDPALGGAGLGTVAMAQIMETLAAADFAIAFSLVVQNNLAGNISRNGTAEQKALHLPPMMAGERLGAFLLTEARGGSDAAAIACAARRDGRDWVLNGSKAWVTNAASADLLSVYAQTDPAKGWRGIACFLVPADAPGVVREAAYAMLGGHALGTGGFRFEDCRVAGDAVLLASERAFKAAMAGIDIARVNVAPMCVGILHSGLAIAVEATARKSAFGQRLADHQGLQWQLADVATEAHAARLMAYDAAAAMDRGDNATVAAAHAKKFASRAALDGLGQCMQALGADGLRHDTPLPRHFAAAKMAAYIDGTTEIQNIVIARDLWRDT
jgi:alkylation response protein AidB-like acyl-CoA dehydrogenase